MTSDFKMPGSNDFRHSSYELPSDHREGLNEMTPRRWALLAWGVFLVILIGIAALDGGRDCKVPKSGPFHRLLEGHKFAPTHVRSWRRFSCSELK
jgi:hypothetical protein